MRLTKKARRFQEAVKRQGPRKRTTPYPSSLRAEAMTYFEARRTAGASIYAVAKELGLGVDTLRRCLAFLRHAFDSRLGRFRNFMSYSRQ